MGEISKEQTRRFAQAFINQCSAEDAQALLPLTKAIAACVDHAAQLAKKAAD